MAKKTKSTKYTTPKVTFRHPRIDKPDTRFGSAIYKVDAVFRSKEDFQHCVEGMIGALKKQTKQDNFKTSWAQTQRNNKDQQLKIGDTPTKIYKSDDGDVYLECRSPLPTRVHDIRGNIYPEGEAPPIGGGTTGKVEVGLVYMEEPIKVLKPYLNGVVLIGFKSYKGMGNQSDELDEGEDLPPMAGEIEYKRAPQTGETNIDGDGEEEDDPDEVTTSDDDKDDDWC